MPNITFSNNPKICAKCGHDKFHPDFTCINDRRTEKWHCLKCGLYNETYCTDYDNELNNLKKYFK